jgi:hypothetical protein
MESRFERKARRRASRGRAIEAAAVAPRPAPQRIDAAHATIEEIVGLGFRIRAGRVIYAKIWPDRASAEEYLANLEKDNV